MARHSGSIWPTRVRRERARRRGQGQAGRSRRTSHGDGAVRREITIALKELTATRTSPLGPPPPPPVLSNAIELTNPRGKRSPWN